jgi:FkbM family methyltransferase
LLVEYLSHIGQDRWVIEVTGGKRGGYFLDFGAFDGLTISNTFQLEKCFGWRGICVEANPRFFVDVCALRSAVAVNAALWPASRQVVGLLDAHGLSSLEAFADDDIMAETRRSVTQQLIMVETLNPTEILDRYGAPTYIDYLSLDIEGGELMVLEHLDLDRYHIALITLEHNHHEARREGARRHLEPIGYEYVEIRNEDWYYHPGHLHAAGLTQAHVDPAAIADTILREYRIREQ